MVDVAHDRDDWRAGAQVVVKVLGSDEAGFNVGLRHALNGVAEVLNDEFGCIGVDHVGDLMHRALLHQQHDDVDGPLGHAVGEFLDGDGLRNNHFAHDLVPGLLHAHRLEALAFPLALQRGH